MKSHNSALSPREDRVAAALRENLQKRKAQARQRETVGPKTAKEPICP